MSANTSEPNVPAMFAPLTAVRAEALEKLHVALEGVADREGILDVAYRTIDTPVGTLLLAATEKGLVRVAYDSEDHDVVLEELAAALSPRSSTRRGAPRRGGARDRRVLRATARSSVPVDFSLSTGFRRSVLRPAADHVRARLRRRRPDRRQPEGGTRGRLGVCDEPGAVVIPLPPGSPWRWGTRRLRQWLAAKTALLDLEAAAA